MSMWKKLLEPRIWRRIYRERAGEPLLYNIASLGALAFGSLRTRIDYDLVPRQPYAYCLLAAADYARRMGTTRITAVEFGVAAGAGLFNICDISRQVTKETSVEFDIVGIDSGVGMPPPRDYRDQPQKYFTGDYPAVDRERLVAALPPNCRILFGPLLPSIEELARTLASPIGFVSVDVDYYWSTVEALTIFEYPAEQLLPLVFTYFDDVQDPEDNVFCGELLAIEEFNTKAILRRIAVANRLTHRRIFKTPVWPHQIYFAHVFDHPARSLEAIGKARNGKVAVVSNPYLGVAEVEATR